MKVSSVYLLAAHELMKGVRFGNAVEDHKIYPSVNCIDGFAICSPESCLSCKESMMNVDNDEHTTSSERNILNEMIDMRNLKGTLPSSEWWLFWYTVTIHSTDVGIDHLTKTINDELTEQRCDINRFWESRTFVINSTNMTHRKGNDAGSSAEKTLKHVNDKFILFKISYEEYKKLPSAHHQQKTLGILWPSHVHSVKFDNMMYHSVASRFSVNETQSSTRPYRSGDNTNDPNYRQKHPSGRYSQVFLPEIVFFIPQPCFTFSFIFNEMAESILTHISKNKDGFGRFFSDLYSDGKHVVKNNINTNNNNSNNNDNTFQTTKTSNSVFVSKQHLRKGYLPRYDVYETGSPIFSCSSMEKEIVGAFNKGRFENRKVKISYLVHINLDKLKAHVENNSQKNSYLIWFWDRVKRKCIEDYAYQLCGMDPPSRKYDKEFSQHGDVKLRRMSNYFDAQHNWPFQGCLESIENFNYQSSILSHSKTNGIEKDNNFRTLNETRPVRAYLMTFSMNDMVSLYKNVSYIELINFGKDVDLVDDLLSGVNKNSHNNNGNKQQNSIHSSSSSSSSLNNRTQHVNNNNDGMDMYSMVKSTQEHNHVVLKASTILMRNVLWMFTQNLRALHSVDVIHGDLHSGNIIYFSSPTVFRTKFTRWSRDKQDLCSTKVNDIHFMGANYHISKYSVPKGSLFRSRANSVDCFDDEDDTNNNRDESKSTNKDGCDAENLPFLPETSNELVVKINHNFIPQLVIIDIEGSHVCESTISNFFSKNDEVGICVPDSKKNMISSDRHQFHKGYIFAECEAQKKLPRCVTYNYNRLKRIDSNPLLSSSIIEGNHSDITQNAEACSCNDYDTCRFCYAGYRLKKIEEIHHQSEMNHKVENRIPVNSKRLVHDLEESNIMAYSEIIVNHSVAPSTEYGYRSPEQTETICQKMDQQTPSADNIKNYDTYKRQIITNLSDIYSFAMCVSSLVVGFTHNSKPNGLRLRRKFERTNHHQHNSVISAAGDTSHTKRDNTIHQKTQKSGSYHYRDQKPAINPKATACQGIDVVCIQSGACERPQSSTDGHLVEGDDSSYLQYGYDLQFGYFPHDARKLVIRYPSDKRQFWELEEGITKFEDAFTVKNTAIEYDKTLIDVLKQKIKTSCTFPSDKWLFSVGPDITDGQRIASFEKSFKQEDREKYDKIIMEVIRHILSQIDAFGLPTKYHNVLMKTFESYPRLNVLKIRGSQHQTQSQQQQQRHRVEPKLYPKSNDSSIRTNLAPMFEEITNYLIKYIDKTYYDNPSQFESLYNRLNRKGWYYYSLTNVMREQFDFSKDEADEFSALISACMSWDAGERPSTLEISHALIFDPLISLDTNTIQQGQQENYGTKQDISSILINPGYYTSYNITSSTNIYSSDFISDHIIKEKTFGTRDVDTGATIFNLLKRRYFSTFRNSTRYKLYKKDYCVEQIFQFGNSLSKKPAVKPSCKSIVSSTREQAAAFYYYTIMSARRCVYNLCTLHMVTTGRSKSIYVMVQDDEENSVLFFCDNVNLFKKSYKLEIDDTKLKNNYFTFLEILIWKMILSCDNVQKEETCNVIKAFYPYLYI